MSIDLESFREGYKLRARMCELEGSCSPHASDRLFRALERNVGVLANNKGSVSSLESSFKQATQIINLFSELDESVSRIRSYGYDGIFSGDLNNIKKIRDDFHRELKRIYLMGEGVISLFDKEGLIRSFVYSQTKTNPVN